MITMITIIKIININNISPKCASIIAIQHTGATALLIDNVARFKNIHIVRSAAITGEAMAENARRIAC